MAKKRGRPKKLERQILDVMEGSCWRIKDLLTSLRKNSIGFDSEATLIAFLNQRPELFGVTENHVWPLKKDILQDKSVERKIEIQPERQTNSKISENQTEMFDYQKLTPVEVHVLDLMRLSENWRILHLRKKLLEEKNSFHCFFDSEEEFRQFLKLRPKLFCMTDVHVRSLIDLRPLKKQLLDLMNKSYWKIDEFLNLLEQKDIEPFKLDNQWTPRNFKDFLKRQPKLFGATNRQVWPLETIFLQNPKNKLDTIQPMKESNYESILHDDGSVKKSNFSRVSSSTNSLNSLSSTMSATPALPLANQLVPKREQTYEEISRTQKFAEECLELLKHVPECRQGPL